MTLVAQLHRKVTEELSPLLREALQYGNREPAAAARPPIPFGEHLVQEELLSRHQLLCALQMQDRHPDMRLGLCAVALGFVQLSEVEAAFGRYTRTACAA